MRQTNSLSENVDLDVVGSSNYGRDQKILASRTFNMIIENGWLIDGAGFKNVIPLIQNGVGRGAFDSIKSGKMIIVIDENVYSIGIFGRHLNNQPVYSILLVGVLNTFAGDVFITENNVGQIAICDKTNLWIYNYLTSSFTQAELPEGVIPGYVWYQNGRFLLTDSGSATWYISAVGDGLNWFPGNSGEPLFNSIQTKADYAQAIFGFPGLGNVILIIGKSVTEFWTNVPAPIFPYQKNTSANYDYGCVNPATIAFSDNVVAWLANNEKSGSIIVYTTGAELKTISEGGINLKLSNLHNPSNSCAFFIKLVDHLLYYITFYDPNDNFTLVYDFTTGKFFDFTDEKMNYFPARKAIFFNNEYYFVSLNDGNVYQLSADFTTYDYGTFQNGSPKTYEIPRIRVCSNLRRIDASKFIINRVTFTIEQGNDVSNDGNDPNYYPRINMSISQDGGYTFSSEIERPIYKVGNRINVLNWHACGQANDLVCQFRFHGKGPWKCTNGNVSIYQ